MPPLEGQERILKSALICSLFPNMPPTLYFSTRDERGKVVLNSWQAAGEARGHVCSRVDSKLRAGENWVVRVVQKDVYFDVI